MNQIPIGLRPHFKALGILGVILLIGDTWLSAKFGYSSGVEMAVIYAAISIASGFLLVVALYFNRLGVKFMARGLMAAWAIAFGFNCWSNMGVSTANRMGDVQQAKVQQTTYDGRKAKIAENENTLKLFTKQLEDLIEQAPWAATVTANALRDQATSLAKQITEEGNTRNGGCKRKCLDLMAKKEAVDKQIGTAEQRSRLEEQKLATQRVIASLRDELSETKSGISGTANQSTLYAKLISWDLAADPNASSVTVANEATGIASAVVLALLAAAVTLAAAWPHLLEVKPMIPGMRTEDEPTASAEQGLRQSDGYSKPAPLEYVSRATSLNDPLVFNKRTIAQLRAFAA